MTEQQILSLDEVAEFLHVHRSTIYRLLAKHELPGFKVGRDYRFRLDALEAWIQEQEKGNAQH